MARALFYFLALVDKKTGWAIAHGWLVVLVHLEIIIDADAPSTSRDLPPLKSPPIPNILVLIIASYLYVFARRNRDAISNLGNAGALGARLFLAPPKSRLVGWMVRSGMDFPRAIEEDLLSWETTLLLCKDPEKLSTKGELKYSDNTFGPKKFRYLTEPLKIQPMHIKDTPLMASYAFHFLVSPDDAIKQIQELLSLRRSAALGKRPLLIWEPAPYSCHPENLSTCLQAAELVDVFSPNDIELAAFFGNQQSTPLDRETVEGLAHKCIDSGIGPLGLGTVVVRAGDEGCCVHSRAQKMPTWLPAYYQSSNKMSNAAAGKVVDPTGAGNAFLGAFAIGFHETKDTILAACYGTVGASFALEQIGMPKRQAVAGGEELWNGADVRSRLEEYMSRLAGEGEVLPT
ncbi:hypothetical protein FGG08_002064 [Glutinoglossum americanum]|uniref:Carbohydrate kinase PfkB domain-containing protein n=1 Tax=Glutinoglossum americanum TaxID=1670608 RepID=A0A9P8IFT2_9PEZI|nr:hypothetical protein FGG08_002064 [Glutinoglossum americanum]